MDDILEDSLGLRSSAGGEETPVSEESPEFTVADFSAPSDAASLQDFVGGHSLSILKNSYKKVYTVDLRNETDLFSYTDMCSLTNVTLDYNPYLPLLESITHIIHCYPHFLAVPVGLIVFNLFKNVVDTLEILKGQLEKLSILYLKESLERLKRYLIYLDICNNIRRWATPRPIFGLACLIFTT